MKKNALIVLGVLLMATLACNLLAGSPGKPSPIAPPPTVKASQAVTKQAPDRTATQKQADKPTETFVSSPTTVKPTAAPTATQPAALGAPVVLANRKMDPAQLAVVDAATGKVKKSFSAVGMIEAAPAYVTADAVFYLDGGFKIVRWAGFDGAAGELAFINPGGELFQGFMLPSPDGKKIAWAVIADQNADSNHNQLMVANKDGSGLAVLVDETSNPPVAWTPIGWSPDGQWLYFASQPYGIGGYILFNGILDVRRAPVQGGNWEIVLPPLPMMGDAALSPDGLTLAYIYTFKARIRMIFRWSWC
jgi:hypothetical protein